MTEALSYWAVVPAAGVGKRMLADIPKQYLRVNDETILDITLSRLLSHEKIDGVVLAVSPGDEYWPESKYYNHANVITVEGGKERSDSVFNALNKLADLQSAEIRVLVHDAARPCIESTDISRLINEVGESPDGGLLGVPVKDTMKQTQSDNRVSSTLDRENLWHAYTPQMFPLQSLLTALNHVRDKRLAVTDDASAMEILGYKPLMVEGSSKNIKITQPDDLALANIYLQNQNL